VLARVTRWFWWKNWPKWSHNLSFVKVINTTASAKKLYNNLGHFCNFEKNCPK
jgi:hypothetical protein